MLEAMRNLQRSQPRLGLFDMNRSLPFVQVHGPDSTTLEHFERLRVMTSGGSSSSRPPDTPMDGPNKGDMMNMDRPDEAQDLKKDEASYKNDNGSSMATPNQSSQ